MSSSRWADCREFNILVMKEKEKKGLATNDNQSLIQTILICHRPLFVAF